MYVNSYTSLLFFFKKNIILKEHSLRLVLCPQLRKKVYFWICIPCVRFDLIKTTGVTNYWSGISYQTLISDSSKIPSCIVLFKEWWVLLDKECHVKSSDFSVLYEAMFFISTTSNSKFKHSLGLGSGVNNQRVLSSSSLLWKNFNGL